MKIEIWQHYHAVNNAPLLSQQCPMDQNTVDQFQVIHLGHHQTLNVIEITIE